jgi:2'-5' RNA ligase
LRDPADVTALLVEPVPTLPFDIERLTLFRSRLGRPAPVYEPIERIALGTGKAL